MLGSALSGIVALSFLGLGAGAYAAPRALAANYGFPVDDDAGVGYVRALGTRDAALGCLVVWCLATDAKGALLATLAASAFVAAGDFGIVLRARGSSVPVSLAIHGGGLIGLLFVAGVVRAER